MGSFRQLARLPDSRPGPTLSPASPGCPSLPPLPFGGSACWGHVYPPSIALMWANRMDGRDRR